MELQHGPARERADFAPNSPLPPAVPANPPLVSRAHAAALRRAHAFAERIAGLGAAGDGTTGKHELCDFTIVGPNSSAGVHFVSTPWAVLRWVHACLPPDAQKHRWTFLDLGAGKGRAVLSAAARPYKQVVGVEFAAELVAVARANVQASRHRSPRVSIVEADATVCKLPDGALIVFLFNPFGPPVIDAVIARLAAHRATTRAPVRVAYLNPVHAALFQHHPAFRPRPLPPHMAALFGIASPYRLALFDAV